MSEFDVQPLAHEKVRTVRIICDGSLQDRVLNAVMKLGAKGYTYWGAHGKGEHDTVPTLTSAFSRSFERIYVEVWCRPEVADRILDYCETSFKGYAMTAGVETLEVVCKGKFQ